MCSGPISLRKCGANKVDCSNQRNEIGNSLVYKYQQLANATIPRMALGAGFDSALAENPW